MKFVPYQIDYAVTNTAKTLGFSKKKVVFKFGFANFDAVQEGQTGAGCRGSEHELTFIWSLATGKRQLWLDGRDVHYSESGMNGWMQDRAWQHAFSMKDATGTYRMHFISQPKNPEDPTSKPFDLRVAGTSYFSFNKLFQLGTPRMMIRDNERGGRGGGGGGKESPTTAEERRQIAAAKAESLRDMGHPSPPRSSQPPPPMKREEVDLLGFDEPAPPPMPQQAPAQFASSSGQFASSSITLDSSFGGSGLIPYGAPPPAANPYASAPQFSQPPPLPQTPQNQYAFGAPAPAPVDAFAQPPPPAASATAGALTTYQPPAGAPAPSPYAMPPQQTYDYSQQQPAYSQQQPAYSQQPVPAPQAAPPAFGSPGAQSYQSYGSAPSFAQPPQPPQPQAFAQPPPAQPYGSNPYGQPPPPAQPYGQAPYPGNPF